MRSPSLFGHTNQFKERKMFVNQTESTQFIQSLKRAGVSIHNEEEVIERLAEAREWHFAFCTLVNQGKRIGIWFAAATKVRSSQLKRLFAKYNFSGNAEAAFEASLHRLA
jgi:hypothetical protein